MNRKDKSVKRRSRQACKRCHDRRVRCDASSKGTPCSGCIASNLAEGCKLIESRKGRGEDGRFSTKATEHIVRRLPNSPTSVSEIPDASPARSEESGSGRLGTSEDVEEAEPVQRPASEAEQWSNFISRRVASVPDGRRMTFVGESWNLSYMIQWKSRAPMADSTEPGNQLHISPSEAESDSPCFHIPMPIQQDTPSPQSTRTSSKLRDQLPDAIQLAIIDAYLAYHHVHYPILNEREFRNDVRDRTISPLLLSAVLYAGSVHVPESVIYRAGFESRQNCVRKLYTRSKNIFFEDENDLDVSDQLSRVQAAFLLHHMWLSPNSIMDCWTWLSLSIRLAQNMGMHRNTARSTLKYEDRKLWKRIWWSLYVRTSHDKRTHS